MKFYNDMLYLGLCALNSVKPDISYVEKIDLDNLFKECQRHSVTALVCYALEPMVVLPEKWSEAKGKAIRKSMLFDVERERVTNFMNENGIKYMPLKGVVLKEFYPKIGMREMSDNDIYYDIAFRDKLEEFMLSLQYKCAGKTDNHDAYEKEPIYNFEFHHKFFLKETSELLHNYYCDIEKRMIRDENNAYGYHLSHEDFYIYLLAHEYKHYSHNGTGIRSLLDCIVFLKEYNNTLDWEYISSEAKKAGLADFEEKQRKLCEKLSTSFVDADLTVEEIDFLEYMISSGVYGNFSTGVLNKVRGENGINSTVTFSKKVSYILKRIFPPMQFYKRFYPFFYKHKYLIPFCFFYRLYLAVFSRNKKIINEIKILNKQDK